MSSLKREITKADLKNRMVVRQRCGTYKVVMDNYLLGVIQYGNLDTDYNDDLTSKITREYDIMEVYGRVKTIYPFLFADCPDIKKLYSVHIPKEELIFLWKRIERISREITVEEIEQKFGCKVKRIVNGEAILYEAGSEV